MLHDSQTNDNVEQFCNVNQWQIVPHYSKIVIKAKLLHMESFAPQTMSAAYDVWEDALTNKDISQGVKIGEKPKKFTMEPPQPATSLACAAC